MFAQVEQQVEVSVPQTTHCPIDDGVLQVAEVLIREIVSVRMKWERERGERKLTRAFCFALEPLSLPRQVR